VRSYVCFLWNTGYRHYTPEHVNILAHALKFWDAEPHRFICVTNTKGAFSSEVEVIKTPKAAERLGSIEAPQGKSFPSSYRRLWCFSEEATCLGDEIMLLDIDAMIVGDMAPLWEIESDFVGWRPMSIWGREDRIGGGTWRHRTGTLTWLWDRFNTDTHKLIQETREQGWTGSDQAILSRFLNKKYPQWPQMCGIYGSQDGVFQWDIPPKDAIIVHFNGAEKAWHHDKLWLKAYHNHFKTPPTRNHKGDGLR
jgi:hypothetical protein